MALAQNDLYCNRAGPHGSSLAPLLGAAARGVCWAGASLTASLASFFAATGCSSPFFGGADGANVTGSSGSGSSSSSRSRSSNFGANGSSLGELVPGQRRRQVAERSDVEATGVPMMLSCLFSMVFAAAIMSAAGSLGILPAPRSECAADQGAYGFCALRRDFRGMLSFALGCWVCCMLAKGHDVGDEAADAHRDLASGSIAPVPHAAQRPTQSLLPMALQPVAGQPPQLTPGTWPLLHALPLFFL